ncbi:hypothetical protein Bbelb_365170 [Branchiostoma belcheri]|nr:hypothetical protein Bbelb_365170 [Branchiostoma belcheri]
MALNPKKCKVLQICFAKVSPPPEPLIISEQTLETVTCIKVLGLTIQNNLKWDQQVDSMVKSSNRRLYMVRRLKRFGVSVPDLVSVYTVYVRPILEYAVPVWYPTLTTKQSKTLERIQMRACKIILGSHGLIGVVAAVGSWVNAVNPKNEKTASKTTRMATANRAPKQWCLTRTESINSYENWQSNLIYVLSLDLSFAPFLADGVTWQKRAPRLEHRGFANDGEDVPERNGELRRRRRRAWN